MYMVAAPLKHAMTKTQLAASTAIATVLVFGAAKILTKTPIPSIPEAKKSDLVVDQRIKGNRAVLLIVEDGKALPKLAALFSVEQRERQGKYGIESYEAVIFQKEEVELFFVVSESGYAHMSAAIQVPVAGGLIVPDAELKDLESRAIQYLREQRIKEYEIITI